MPLAAFLGCTEMSDDTAAAAELERLALELLLELLVELLVEFELELAFDVDVELALEQVVDELDMPADGLGVDVRVDEVDDTDDAPGDRMLLLLRCFLCGLRPGAAVATCGVNTSVLLDDDISQSEPEFEPGGVGGRARLDDSCGLASGLPELRRAARVTFLAAADDTLLTAFLASDSAFELLVQLDIRLVPESVDPWPRVGPHDEPFRSVE